MDSGFTLIELVVVVAIVAVMAATLLPRVWHLQREARIGNLQGTRGAMHATATLIHSAALARNGQPDAAPCPGGGGTADNRLDGRGTVCTESGLVAMQHGYPAATASGPSRLPGMVGGDGYIVTIDAQVATIARADASVPAQCSFTYTEPLVARTAASISPALVSGC